MIPINPSIDCHRGRETRAQNTANNMLQLRHESNITKPPGLGALYGQGSTYLDIIAWCAINAEASAGIANQAAVFRTLDIQSRVVVTSCLILTPTS